MTSKERITRVVAALDDIRAGKMVILVDDEDRENEGDLTMAAEKVTPEAINFMAKHGRGLICLTLTEEQARRARAAAAVGAQGRRLAASAPRSPSRIEARQGVTTGISAEDRAHDDLAAVAPEREAEDLVTPGHVFPLRAKRGGVLVRTGQTEGSVDLARLAGLVAGGRHLRDHERRRHDGAHARPREVRGAARAAHPVDRRPHPVPAAAGVAGREARRRRR